MNRVRSTNLPALVMLLALCMSPAQAQEEWVASVAQRSQTAVVTVISYDGENRQISLGSGFVIREDGLIATNYHVIKSAKVVEVSNPTIGKYRVRGVVAVDRKLDLAVLKIQGDNLNALVLGNSAQVRLGESIVAIGNPKGLSGTVSAGLISQIRDESSYRMLQISAPIYPGNSGGPLINRRGEVIGIITARVGDGPTLGLALPINYLRQALHGTETAFYSFRELDQIEGQESERETAERLESAIRENFRTYQDPQGLFKLLIPREWRIQHEAARSRDGQQSTSTTVVTPGGAALSELNGYVSEGLRIVAHTPREGNVWTPATLGNWEKSVVRDLLAANPGFAHTKTERLPMLADGRLKGKTATLYHFVGEDSRLSEPEKTVKLFIANPEVILSIEFIAPTSKIQMLDIMQVITLLSFSWKGY
jgi:hypothetical protein